MFNSEMTIVVASCDKYADMLIPFSQCFKKFWPACNYEIVINTETAPKLPENLIYNKVFAWGKQAWVKRLLNTLNELDTKYIFLILDDFFIDNNYTNEEMQKWLEIVKLHNAASLKMKPTVVQLDNIDEFVGEQPKGKAYRVNAQVAIWDKDYLKNILTDLGDEEMWNFERMGTVYSEKYAQSHLCTFQLQFPYIEMICAGRWLSSGLKFCKKEQIAIKENIRDEEPKSYYRYRMFRGVIFRICPTLITNIKLFIQK